MAANTGAGLKGLRDRALLLLGLRWRIWLLGAGRARYVGHRGRAQSRAFVARGIPDQRREPGSFDFQDDGREPPPLS
jgi:hypothetical protein